MNTVINLSEFTRMPAVEIARGDSVGRALHIQTPHKGEVVLDYHEQGIFREKNKDMELLVSKIRNLEWEAKEYLLSKWLKDFNSPS